MSEENENLSDRSDTSLPHLDTEFEGQAPVFTEQEEPRLTESLAKPKPPLFALVGLV